MAKTKAELKSDQDNYHHLLKNARVALSEQRVKDAIDLAKSTWPYIDGMMQFEQRYENREFTTVEGVAIVLRNAPLVFDRQTLNELAELLKSKRRIDKNASDDLAAQLAASRA